jgi:phage baseplate assembly protein W
MSDLLLGTPNPNVSSLDLSRKYALDGNSDVQFDSRGQLITVSGADKVKQYLGKIFTTTQGDNPIDTSYGTTLETFIGGKIDDETNYSLIKQTILDAVAYAINQYNNSLNASEQINAIETFSTMIDTKTNNTTHLIVELTVTLVSGQTLTVGTVI